MTTRFYLMLERLQRLDATLRLAQSRGNADPIELARVRARKRTLGRRVAQLMQHQLPQSA